MANILSNAIKANDETEAVEAKTSIVTPLYFRGRLRDSWFQDQNKIPSHMCNDIATPSNRSATVRERSR